MKRLTEKNDDGRWQLAGVSWEALSEGKVITKEISTKLYLALCKLMDYEDTGLAPVEVEQVNDFERTQTAHFLKELNEEQRKHRWISVEEGLPEPGQIVLVCQIYSWMNFEDGAQVTIGRLRPADKTHNPYWEFQHYRPDFKHGTIMDNGIICPGNEYVTHWMPLPEPA